MVRRSFVLAVLLAPLLIASTACGTSDTQRPPTTSVTPSTRADGSVAISSTPSSQWGELASCPLHAATPASGTPAPEKIDGVESFPIQSQKHKDGCIEYEVYPPIGGAHNGIWANCGFYTSPVPNEHAVHSMEHGGVWITFSPDLPQADLAKVIGAAEASRFVLASPYPNLGSPLILNAWTRQLRLDSASDPRFALFISRYVQGPQTPELGPPCWDGLGTPG